MQINVSFDQSTKFLPSAFVTAVNWAVSYLDNLFTNNVTLNINVGYGEVGGYSLGGALGASIGNYVSASYSSVRSALLAENAPGASTLPATSPVPGTLYMPIAEAQALGLTSSSVLDGWVGFSNNVSWSFTPNVTPSPGAYDFIGTFEHEITEIMGRVSLIDYQPSFYAVADLYRYTATGAHSLTTGGSGSLAYFSVDGGHTLLASWNNNPANGDLGDWYGQASKDMANDYATPGVLNPFSAVDVTEMEALGWTTTSASSRTGAGPASGPTLPPAPIITSFSPDTGVVGDGITDANVLTLTGTAVSNSTVKIYDGTTLLGSVTASTSGTWNFTTAALVDGTHHFTGTDGDTSGNVSSPSNTFNVTVDTVAPNAPVIVSDTIVYSNEILLSGTSEANATIRVYEGTTLLGSVHASTSGAWSYTTASLTDGTHTLSATATDVAANTSPASQSVSLTIASKATTSTTASNPDPGLTFKSFGNALPQTDAFVFSNEIVRDLNPDPHVSADAVHNDSAAFLHLADEFVNAAKVEATVITLSDLADLLGVHNNAPNDPHGGFHG